MSDRVAFLNGEIVPEADAKISIRDAGVVYGDGVFDTARTFDGKLFRMAEHVERLFESLAYARIDPGMTREEILTATEKLVQANRSVLRKGEDYWVTVRITSGQQAFDGEVAANAGSTVMIDAVPLPLRARANYFRDGIKAVVPGRRRVAPEALSPNAKTNNYMNMIIAQREVAAVSPGSWALMLDPNGDMAEGPGSNFFVVRHGVVFTPTKEFVLAGVSRQVVIELCAKLGIECREQTLPLHAAMVADEAFFTSTSLCVCPVSHLNGAAYPSTVPGPVTKRIMDGFADLVGHDYVGQYLRFAGGSGVNAGL
ncbi:MAG: aminotransferase class IV [Rhodobacterales bacterium]|jgi:branched-chain amino acid aminotransferase|nr:aminotransferase class IV [Rhodobacter sp.]